MIMRHGSAEAFAPEDRYQTASELLVELGRSGLAAVVPAFIDRDLTLQDPLVRDRLTAPVQPTLPDLHGPAPITGGRDSAAELTVGDPGPEEPSDF